MKRPEQQRARRILTLELAVVLPAAALVVLSVIHLRSIQRDRQVEAAFQRARLLGAEAPEIVAVEYIDMQRTNVSDLKGKVILLDFLAHWCAPCIASFPELDVLEKKYEASGLVVLGITSYYGFFGSREKVSPAEELTELKSLKEKQQVKFGFIVGPRDNETAYGIAGLPAYGLIDRNGRVQYLEPGKTKRLEQTIQRLLHEPPPKW